MQTYKIHESKGSEKVVKSINEDELTNYCSPKYAKSIMEANKNGSLWGLYFTKSGKIWATFI